MLKSYDIYSVIVGVSPPESFLGKVRFILRLKGDEVYERRTIKGCLSLILDAKLL